MSKQKSVSVSYDKDIELETVVEVSQGSKVQIDSATYSLLDQRRAAIVDHIEKSKEAAYGFNRGFGHNVDVAIEPAEVELLQKNLIRSHASGVGDAAPVEVVRAAMFLRLQSLIKGHSGVRSGVVRQLVFFLNNEITPEVPLFGSVGASGDLAPLAHIALALIGEGKVFYKGERRESSEVLTELAGESLTLEMKEGLALTNGMQFSLAIGILALQNAECLLRTATVATALGVQVMLGSDEPFDDEFQALRPHAGALKIARHLRFLMKDSPIRESHRNYDIDGEVQDPYNLRCAAQILGAAEDLLEDARKSFRIEANSATDNPLLLRNNEGKFIRIVSGGHFHGMPIAIRLHGLSQALAIISSLSNTRAARYVDPHRNKGLGSDIIWPELPAAERRCSSGMMIPEYASAALTNFVLGQTQPSHLYSISTDAGQEDHVSMAAGLAVRLWQTLPRVAEVLGIELAYAFQAAKVRKVKNHFPSKLCVSASDMKEIEDTVGQLKKKIMAALGEKFEVELPIQTFFKLTPQERFLSPLCERALERIGEYFSVVHEDRSLSEEIRALAVYIQEHDIFYEITDEIKR